MNRLERPFLLAAVLLTGCGTTRNVAVSSYHVTRDVAVGSYRVATAPVHYALGRRGEPTMVGTTDASSDVTEPGQPVSTSQVASTAQRHTKRQTASSQSSARTTPQAARSETTQPKPSSSAKTSYPQSEFPTAKAVPDKPGYVFSPFDSSGRYVDVSGYASGTKVKDPWTDKIFVVP
jgi:hypothetical protein